MFDATKSNHLQSDVILMCAESIKCGEWLNLHLKKVDPRGFHPGVETEAECWEKCESNIQCEFSAYFAAPHHCYMNALTADSYASRGDTAQSRFKCDPELDITSVVKPSAGMS